MDNELIYMALFGLVGVGAIIIGVKLIIGQRKFISSAIETEGVVVGMEKMRGRGGLLSPVVEFIDNEGRKIRFTSSIARSENPHKEGNRVEVLYDQDGHKMDLAENVRLSGIGLMIPLGLIVIGAFFFLSAVMLLLLS